MRTELNEMDALVSQTEAAMFRIMSSMFGAQSNAGPSDAQIEAALRHDSAKRIPATGYAGGRPSGVSHGDIPAIRADIEPSSDRFFDRTIPQATTMLLREAAGPLHVNEVYNRLLEGGFKFTGNNPTISIAVSLNRNQRFRKVAPGTFDLVIRDATKAS
ncbi:MAG: winged helix-turn-helix domain-containing protein [Acidobacteria bacterium]|nr:winged helix-turn-helix domain-containing protein [Acidobacteriota bacterium]